MIWMCDYCTRWHRGGSNFCDRCARAAKGRICAKSSCEVVVADDATCCPQCGGKQFIEHAIRLYKAPLSMRLTTLTLHLLLVYLAFVYLIPLTIWLVTTVVDFTFLALTMAAGGMFIFWFFTAILPTPARQAVRSGAWSILKFIWRLIVGLLRW